jgi:hypothetical protein
MRGAINMKPIIPAQTFTALVEVRFTDSTQIFSRPHVFVVIINNTVSRKGCLICKQGDDVERKISRQLTQEPLTVVNKWDIGGGVTVAGSETNVNT